MPCLETHWKFTFEIKDMVSNFSTQSVKPLLQSSWALRNLTSPKKRKQLNIDLWCILSKTPPFLPSKLFYAIKKRGVRCTKAPTYTGYGKGSHHFGVLYATLPCFLHKRLFPGLEPVTFQSHDSNFTVAPRLPLIFYAI